MLVLVRHAEPVASPDRPAFDWPLSDAGRRAAAALMHRLGSALGAVPASSPVALVSSDERRAWETLGGHDGVRTDPRFGEVRRVEERWSDDFGRLRRAYVQGRRHPGWEDPAEVAARFEAGVADLTGGATVVGTHGMVLTLWLVSRGAVDPGEAGDFWADLRFPDCLVLGADGRSVRRIEPSDEAHPGG